MIECLPKETKKEMARIMRNKAKAVAREGSDPAEYERLEYMFAKRVPDCKYLPGRIHKSWMPEPVPEGGGEPFPAATHQEIENDISMQMTMAAAQPGVQIGNIMRDLVENHEPGPDEPTYVRVGKVQDPYDLKDKKDRYLKSETAFENPSNPDKFHTIGDAMYFEDDEMKSKWKKVGIIESAGFAQAAMEPPKKVHVRPTEERVVAEAAKVLPPETIRISEEVREQLKKITPSARPKKPRDLSASIARCIINTRTLAQKLRDYDPAAKQSLQELADKLKELRHIEATTDDNEELNRVQAEIPRIERDLKKFKKMSPEAIRAEFEDLTEKCPGVDVSYHDKLNMHSNVIRLHYKANATESQSLVVRDEAKQLYEQLLK